MAKLYVFAIGGTGSRVLRPFIYLLAAGVKPKGFDEVVPIIIDADKACGDRTKALNDLKDYKFIYDKIESQNEQKEPEGFFHTKISQICDNKSSFLMNVFGEGTEEPFSDYIDFPHMNEDDQRIVKFLFSEENLSAKMNVGFKGNPNIGSVVLNGFEDSKDYSDLRDSFQSGDAIFIISSIFGGTGASGFPLLINTLNSKNSKIGINNAKIGGITVLPYFKAKEPRGEGQLDTSTFIQKTKAALEYYKKHLEDHIDYLYYVGDKQRAAYENHDGGEKQENPPHFVEFISALAIFHFAERASVAGKRQKTEHYEYGIKKDCKEIFLDDMWQWQRDPNLPEEENIQDVKPKMCMFELFANFIMQAEQESWKYTWADLPPKLINIKGKEFMEHIKNFAKSYTEWFKNCKKQTERQFLPFKTDEHLEKGFESERIFDIVANKTGKNPGLFFMAKNYYIFNDSLDIARKEIKNSDTKKLEQIFIILFWNVCKELFDKYISHNIK